MVDLSKRRIVAQLPAVHQTETLKKFFGATADHLFQPGRAETISGYIGQKPVYYDEAKDFYIIEPSAVRTAHQLEPMMISLDADGQIGSSLFYDDLVGHLRSRGADVSDEHRLFETDYYSWAPPIDPDKLINFSLYYYFPVGLQPRLTIRAARTSRIAGPFDEIYTLPPAHPGITGRESIRVFVDGVPAEVLTSDATTVTLASFPPVGAEVVVFRYGDLRTLIEGLASFDPGSLTTEAVSALVGGMRIYLDDALTEYGGYDRQGFESYDLSAEIPWDSLSSRTFLVEFQNGAIVLLSEDDLLGDGVIDYVTIHRLSRDKNIWSRRNRWVHRQAFGWAIGGEAFSQYQARRPIIEFREDLRLWNYGAIRLPDVQAKMTAMAVWNGTTPIALAEIAGKAEGTVAVDGGRILANGYRLLVEIDEDGDAYHRIYAVDVVGGVYDLIDQGIVETGAIVMGRFTGNPDDVTEWWFDGSNWRPAQSAAFPPRFMLYDKDGVSLDDPGVYPGSDFEGNRLFAYAEDPNASIDPYVLVRIKRNSFGYLVFESVSYTERSTWDGGAISGLQFHAYNPATPGDPLVFGCDWQPVATPTTQPLADGVFAIPSNLQSNPDTEAVTTLARNDWSTHFQAIMTAQAGFSGNAFSTNNWRETARDLTKPGTILQHRAPLLRLMLTAADRRFDVATVLRFAEQEYARFRAKFVQKIVEFRTNGTRVDSDPPAAWVDSVLAALKANKTSEFPFAWSTMGGGNHFIPPTPAFLGIASPVTPGLVVDAAFYDPAVTFIRGHDGSLTPAYGDVRDAVLLELETRIHASIPAAFKTGARPVFDIDRYIGHHFRPDPANGYTNADVDRLLTPLFERWAQANRLDYRTNRTFDSVDPWTWNWRDVTDRFGDPLTIGHWRGIYRYYYGTDRPDIRPWEMLGFESEPDWWTAVYGPAPYTRGNTILWDDLEAGRIAQGPRAGISADHARPGLSDILPVDAFGALLDPVVAGIARYAPTYQDASRAWRMGDHGPVESLWRASPSYPFAKALVGFLMKPARFVEQTWDALNHVLVHGTQWVDALTGDRPRNASRLVHGETDVDGGRVVRHGLQQWLSDYLVSRGLSPSILGDAVRGLTARLGHKMAGFTKESGLRVIADNFGLVPPENVSVLFYRSPSVREEFYSGVIVERTTDGWRVIGYDALDPTFRVIPGDPFGPKTAISLSDTPEPIITDWRSNTYYTIGNLVIFEGSTYRATRSHTSGRDFEQTFWSAEPGLAGPQAPRVVKYLRGLDTVETVPYGTVFATFQQVSDFLLGHERYMVARGWRFEQTDPDTQIVRDWTLMVRQFLAWAQVGWMPGNFIALSPAYDRVDFSTDFGLIDNTETDFNGVYGLVDRQGLPIARQESAVTRLDGDLTVRVATDDLFGCRVSIVEVEHALVFSNETIFADVIYQPLYGLRQPRLRLLGQRTLGWKGRYDAPGYVLIDGDLVPNYERQAEDVREMFDIERADNDTLRKHARHLIGYQERPYLTQLVFSETQQIEFYQGMIQAKGSPGIYDRLLRSNFVGQNRELRFYEEWAFQLGTYGARDAVERLSFQLPQSALRRNPQFIRFREDEGAIDDPSDDRIELVDAGGDQDPRWVERPSTLTPFPQRDDHSRPPGALPSAGYVRLDEVTFTMFRMRGIDDLSLFYEGLIGGNTLLAGSRLWIYDTGLGDWTILKSCPMSASGTANTILEIETNAENNAVATTTNRIFMTAAHGLTSADVGLYVVIDGETFGTPDLRGIRQITAVNVGANWFEIADGGEEGHDFTSTPDLRPEVRVLRSVRFATNAARDTAEARLFLSAGERVYVDDPLALGTWQVQSYVSPGTYTVARQQPRKMQSARINNALVYDLDTRITERRLMPQPLILDRLLVFDPLSGLIPGAADAEIDFKIEADPAQYGVGRESPDTWGSEQVGRLWWDLSTVRYQEAESDVLDSGDDSRTATEIAHRIATWGRLAPGSSIDVYEWFESPVSPLDWADAQAADTTGALTGTLYNPDAPAWVEGLRYDPTTNTTRTVYWFWVKGRTTIPRRENRTLEATAVARLLAAPATGDVPWLAPVTPDGLLVGGISPFLDDTGTVLQIEVQRTLYDGPVHTEWALLRPGDARAIPPAWFWTKLRDSLSGFDDTGREVPDDTLHPMTQTGVGHRQSLFSDGRSGLLDARESFVGIVNTILARTSLATDRTAALTALMSAASPLTETLIWTSTDGRVELPPPSALWTHEVHSIAERNALILTQEFRDRIVDLDPVWRVLVNGSQNSTPQWSIWRFVPTVESQGWDDNELIENADSLFEIADTYDASFASFAAMNVSPSPTVNDYALVQAPGSFWRLYRYSNGTPTDFWSLAHSQSYRVSDFVEEIDWFETGYSADFPPVVSYPDFVARNQAENPAPATTFVRVDDDGSGRWAWTVWDGGAWRTVARQNGTIRLTTDLHDPARLPYENAPFATDDAVAARDGSRELRVIVDLLDGLLTDIEKNEIMFSMLHFIHTQQDQVPWAFKTSFMVITGFREPLVQSPVQITDNTEALLDYVEEVKPYHVKIRDLTRSYTPDLDQATVRPTDFDKPVYYDPVQDRFRTLDEGVVSDLTTMTTTYPWKDWIEVYTKLGTDPTDPETFGPQRRIGTTIKFDRIDDPALDDFSGWDIPLLDVFGLDDDANLNPDSVDYQTAAVRIRGYYDPRPGMRPDDLGILMQTGFKGGVLDGSALDPDVTVDWDIGLDAATLANTSVEIETEENADIDGRPGLGLTDPHTASGRAPEAIRLHPMENINIAVRAEASPGGLAQTLRYFDVRAETANSRTLAFGAIPESAGSVAIFRDGVRVDEDAAVDSFGMAADVPITGSSNVIVHAFGFGGESRVIHQSFHRATGNAAFPLATNTVLTSRASQPTTLDTIANTVVEVRVNGVVAAGTFANGQVTVSPTPSANADVMIILRDADQTISRMRTNTHVYTGNAVFALSDPTTPQEYENVATIVEVNGLRLMPPETHVKSLSTSDRVIYLNGTPDLANVSVTVNGNASVLAVANIGETISTLLANTASFFTLIDNAVVSRDPVLTGNAIVTVMGQHDYHVSNGVLTITKTLVANDVVRATTFANCVALGPRTFTARPNANAVMTVARPFSPMHTWTTIDGRRVVPEQHFAFTGSTTIQFDRTKAPIGYDWTNAAVVATVFLHAPATPDMAWNAITHAPAASHLIENPDYTAGIIGWDNHDVGDGFDDVDYDALSPELPYLMAAEAWRFVRRPIAHTAMLETDLEANATVVFLTLNPAGLPERLEPEDPLSDPAKTGQPGVAWVGGERIVYHAIEREGSSVALLQIRRGTKGTAIGAEDRTVQTILANGSQTVFRLTNASVSRPVEVGTVAAGTSTHETRIAGIDYGLAEDGADVLVTFTTPPGTNTTVVLAQRFSQTVHRAGTPVYDGTLDMAARTFVVEDNKTSHDHINYLLRSWT